MGHNINGKLRFVPICSGEHEILFGELQVGTIDRLYVYETDRKNARAIPSWHVELWPKPDMTFVGLNVRKLTRARLGEAKEEVRRILEEEGQWWNN